MQAKCEGEGYKLLQEELFSTLVDFDFDLDGVIFEQDNAAVHTSRLVEEWFQE